jgi:hypothetical protein
MNAQDFLTALGLPKAAMVHQRVPKKAFLDHGMLSTTDKKILSSAVDDLWWEACIKPSNVSIPAYNDGETHCEEIEVFQIALRDPAKVERIARLLHHTIPYPILVFGNIGTGFVSVARKRASLSQTERVVLLEHIFATVPVAHTTEFLESLHLSRLSHFHLQATYEGWFARVIALQRIALDGRFLVADSPEDLAAQRGEMDRIAAVRSRIRALLAAAKGERSIRRLAEINLEVKRLEAEL